jgi:SAM-dependent methyltransferase
MEDKNNLNIDLKKDPNEQITNQMVIWAYRLFLGREPENEFVISNKVSRLHSVKDLREEFLKSEEFQKNQNGHSIYNDEFGMIIENTQNNSEQIAIFNHIQKTWELLGKNDPHWSVLTSNAYKKEKITSTKSPFYESGKEEVKDFFNILKRNNIGFKGKTCLEYGCGVGRVTAELSNHVNYVYGCDISKFHLDIAQKYFIEREINNIKLIHIGSVDDIFKMPKVDLIYSKLVLQHNPPPIIKIIIQELIRSLNPGGIAFFQVPTYKENYRFVVTEYLNNFLNNQNMEMHVLPQREIFHIIEDESAMVIEVLEDGCAGNNFRSNSFLIQKKTSRM